MVTAGVSGAIAAVFPPHDAPDQARDDVIASALAILVFSTTAMLAVGVPTSRLVAVFLFHDAGLGPVVRIHLVTIAFAILAAPLTLRLQLTGRAGVFVAISTVSAVASATLTVWAVSSSAQPVLAYVYASVAAQAVNLLCLAIPAAHDRPRFSISKGTVLRILRAGLPLMPAFLFTFGITQSTRLVLERQSDLATVGLFSVGNNLGAAISLLIGSFQNAWVPYFLSVDRRSRPAAEGLARIATLHLFVGGLAALAFFAAARPVVELLTPPTFVLAYLAVGPTALGYVLLNQYNVLLPTLFFNAKTHIQTPLQAGGAAAVIGASFLLIPINPIVGASLAFPLGTGVLVLLTATYVQRRPAAVAVPYDHVRLTLLLACLALCAVVLYVGAALLPHAAVLPFGIVGFVVSGLTMAVGLPDSDRRLVFRQLRRAGAG